MTWREPIVAGLVLVVLLHVGMAVRTATALRRTGVPPVRAWAASLLAWPLVRRAVALHVDAEDGYGAGDEDGSGAGDARGGGPDGDR